MMSATRSDEYYFPRGDLVLQIEDNIFRLHRDILELHSGLFRDMLSIPTSDHQEGTSDEHPLCIPKDLSSAQAFTTLCKFIYPREAGKVPEVWAKDINQWEPILEATRALQMTGVQNCILDKFENDISGISSEPAKLLAWAIRSDVPLEKLKLECARALVFRCLPILPNEGVTLGGKATAQLMYTRERVRASLSTLSGTLPQSIILSDSCHSPSSCRNKIYQAILKNMNTDPQKKFKHSLQADIFQIDDNSMCDACRPNKVTLANTLKAPNGRLDQEIRRCMNALEL